MAHLPPPSRFWVFGSGRFGQLAVNRILTKNPGATITQIDKQHPRETPKQVLQVEADASSWLTANLTPSSKIDMVIPAVPFHLAAEWLCMVAHKTLSPLSVKDQWLECFPNPMAGKKGQVYTSHADFLCPDNCNEPASHCTHTKKQRPRDLFRLLADCSFPTTEILVFRSHQILPGVGGIYPKDLLNGLDQVENSIKKHLMVATACRCHGVIHFYTQS